MSQRQLLSNEACELMLRKNSRRQAVNRCLSYCLLFIAGCGSGAQDAAAPSTQSDTPAAAGAAPNSPSQGRTAPQKKVAVAAPTKEQIERWTPAAFDPVKLLAIREWKKTSFTSCLAPTSDGQHFLVAGSRVLLWSLDKEEPEHVFLELTADDKERTMLSIAVAPDGKWFAVGDSTGTVRIWSLEDRKEIVTKQLGQTGIQHLAISPDGQELATISYDSDVTTWSPTTLEQQKKFKVNTNGLKRIEYTAPKMLAAAGENISLWNTGSGDVVQELSPGRYSFAMGRSPDGTKFIFGAEESLRIWNIADAKQEAEIKGLTGRELLAFSPDGKFLATTSGRSLQLWNLAERRAAQVIDGFGWPMVGMAWLPKTNLLVVASDIGCTRIWGTASQGEPLGLKPLHAPLAMPTADSSATLSQMEQVIDLRTFPRLPGCDATIVSECDFNGVVAVSVGEANSFYKYFLEKDGWTAAETPSANPNAMDFRKNGFTLTVSCFDAGDGKTNIMLQNAGNYDLRKTVKFDAAPVETVYEAPNMVSYRTKADLLRIETTLLRKLHAAGWTGYSRLNSSHREEPDDRDMTFLRDGATLRVSIGKFANDPSSYNIQYSLFANHCSVPVPSDAGYAEFDGSTEPLLVATTKLTLDQAREFYDKALTAQGWLVREVGRSEKEDHMWLSFLRNQSDLSIGLTKLPDGRTLVRVGKLTNSLWEESQKKEKKGDAKEAAGLEAADFPVASLPAKFDANEKSIEVTVEKSTLAAAAKKFTEALAALGWTAEDGGIRDEEYTLLRFKNGKKEITLRARSKDGNAVVNFQGDGLSWKKELPTGKKVISFEGWLHQNKLPAGLEQLERYETEMRAIQPAKS